MVHRVNRHRLLKMRAPTRHCSLGCSPFMPNEWRHIALGAHERDLRRCEGDAPLCVGQISRQQCRTFSGNYGCISDAVPLKDLLVWAPSIFPPLGFSSTGAPNLPPYTKLLSPPALFLSASNLLLVQVVVPQRSKRRSQQGSHSLDFGRDGAHNGSAR